MYHEKDKYLYEIKEHRETPQDAQERAYQEWLVSLEDDDRDPFQEILDNEWDSYFGNEWDSYFGREVV